VADTEEVFNTCLLNKKAKQPPPAKKKNKKKHLAALFQGNYQIKLPNPGGMGGMSPGRPWSALLFPPNR
jgi:hypothetical protein